MPQVGFKPTISASERPYPHYLDRTAMLLVSDLTGIIFTPNSEEDTTSEFNVSNTDKHSDLINPFF